MRLRYFSLRARRRSRRRRPRAECSVPGREPPAATALALVELRRRVPIAPKAARTQWCTCPSAACGSSQRCPRTPERHPRVPCSVRGPGTSAGPAGGRLAAHTHGPIDISSCDATELPSTASRAVVLWAAYGFVSAAHAPHALPVVQVHRSDRPALTEQPAEARSSPRRLGQIYTFRRKRQCLCGQK